ncbi:MAG: dihydropteroate synthase, partial [Bacteroidota bacterium]
RTINCKGRLVDLSQPKIMGILNVTPDSFFDGGKYTSEKNMLQQVEKMLAEGADFIDVGGMSSRPGAEVISVEEELGRVLPVVRAIHKHFPDALISIDTVRSEVARQTVEAGAALVNDISAGRFDDQLYQTVASLGVPYILMHMQGQPSNMQDAPEYEDVITEVLDFCIAQLKELRALGIKDVIIDPGFGFGKSVEHNYQLLQNMHAFQILDLPILAGVSRKSMICKLLKVDPAQALNGSTALHMIALQQGASILRVHDVKEARQVVQLWEMLENSTIQ